jgi:hypothetical protein
MPTLRERLEALASARPGHADSSSEDEAALPGARAQHQAAPLPRSRMRSRAQFEADMADEKYSGVVVKSVKQALAAGFRSRQASGGDDEGAAGEEEEDGDEEEEGEEEEEEGDEDEDEDEVEGGEAEDMRDDDDEEEEEEEEEEEDGGEEDEEEDEEEEGGGAARRALPSADSADDELLALMAADATALSRYRSAEQEDAARGAQVATQVAAADACVEARIRLQATLAASHRLPRASAHAEACAASASVRAAFERLRATAGLLLKDLLELRAELAPTPAARAACALPEAGFPTSDAVWGAIEAGWEAQRPWREETLDTWGRRLALGGGGMSAAKAAKLKILGAGSLTEQVAEGMRHHEAAGRRRGECVARSAVGRVLCSGEAAAAAAAAAPEAGAGDAEALDEETWQDDDLYASLLRDFLAGGGGGAAAAGLAAGAAKSRAKRKAKEGLDRRASKARKLKCVPCAHAAGGARFFSEPSLCSLCASPSLRLSRRPPPPPTHTFFLRTPSPGLSCTPSW